MAFFLLRAADERVGYEPSASGLRAVERAAVERAVYGLSTRCLRAVRHIQKLIEWVYNTAKAS